MTETAFFKLFVAIVITSILVLPEFFKTPKGRTRELSCLEVCLLPNFTYPLSSFNFSSVALLQPAEETQTIMGIFPNHSSFQSFTEICQGITSGFPMCSLCLVCESKEDVDFISQEQTSEGLIMRGLMEVKANDFYSPCQHFNVTVALTVDPTKDYNTTCTPETLPEEVAAVEEAPAREESLNHTCRIMRNMDNCTHISLLLEMDVKCHKYKSTSVLLSGSDSVKLSAVDGRVIPESTRGLPLTRVMDMLPPIPELEATSGVHQQDQSTRLFVDNLD
ncbi:transmembrane protein 156 isoform X3 [Psammomys obesus]|uniref:transmembrane protein 156 isoform X3 n=1 Tax=Psammomys obesus TaxID=48139 RepID=UPI0024533DA8|nr:transmembrane protein 156 isoform X3 [Psammomys obesus]